MTSQSRVLRGLFAPGKRVGCALVAALPLMAPPLYAAEEGAARSAGLPSDPFAAASLLQLLAGLVMVLVLIGASAWLLRRLNRLQSAAGGRMKIIGGLSMGTRERVVLVQVGKQQLLLGVAPGRVQTLHVLAEPLESAAESAAPGGFAQRLQAAMRQRGKS